jgi:hypothetical protein
MSSAVEVRSVADKLKGNVGIPPLAGGNSQQNLQRDLRLLKVRHTVVGGRGTHIMLQRRSAVCGAPLASFGQ